MQDVSRENFGICRCCEQEKLIYKDGFCKNCYTFKVQRKYVLNPKVKRSPKNAPYDLINEINDRQINISITSLAEKYGLSRQRVHKIIESYFDIVYVKYDGKKEFIKNEDVEVELKVDYDDENDMILLKGIKGKIIKINAKHLREVLDKKETM